METLARITGLLSLAAFAAFFANVIAGSFWRDRYLSDIGEMLMLVFGSAAFGVLVLIRERQAGQDRLEAPPEQSGRP